MNFCFQPFYLYFLELMDICQLRVNTGLWYCHQIKFTTKKSLEGIVTNIVQGYVESQWSEQESGDESGFYLAFFPACFLLLLLILSGDVELNPGPKISM